MKKKTLLFSLIMIMLMITACAAAKFDYDNGEIRFNYDTEVWRITGESETDWYKIISLEDAGTGDTVKISYGNSGHLHTDNPGAYVAQQEQIERLYGHIVSDEQTQEFKVGRNGFTVYEYDVDGTTHKRFMFIKSKQGEVQIEETFVSESGNCEDLEDSITYYDNQEAD